ncbi:MAG: hypothetical protein AB8G22_03375 [Saprospiraceae bacterium]
MKNCLVLLFFFATLPMALAQLQFNPKIGWNKFKYKPADESTLTSTKERGYQLGADIRIGGITYLQTGVHFTVLSNRFRSILIDVNEVEKTQLRAVRVPLSIGRSFLDVEVFQLHSRIGGVLHLPLAAGEGTLMIDDYEELNFAATVALGIEVSRLTFDIQFEHAVTDFLITDPNSKYHLWTFSLGYLF